MEKYHLIFNPNADNGAHTADYPKIESFFQSVSTTCHSSYTEFPLHAQQLAYEAVKDGASTLISIGGDGTLNEVINGILQADGHPVLGVIPAGSCNDFIKTLGIPANIDTACQVAAGGTTIGCDVILAGDRYFVNAAGIGFDVHVVEQTRKQRTRNGLSYLWTVLKNIFQYKAMHLNVINGKDYFEPKALMLTIANGQYYGGQFHIAPQADISDGCMDAILMRDVPGFQRLGLLSKVLHGTHLGDKAVESFHAKDLVIKSEQEMSLQIEGEIYKWPHREINFKILPGRLRVLAPKGRGETDE